MPITKNGKDGIGMTSLIDVASSDFAGYLDFSNRWNGSIYCVFTIRHTIF